MAAARDQAVMSRPLRLAVSLLNVSGARDPKLVEAVAWAALQTPHGRLFPNATVLNVFADPEYNRSVITVVAPVETLGESLVSACVRACALIDVSAHSGGHPCLGSVDLVPVHPLSDSVGLRECGRVAQAVARELTLQVPGASVFLFGWADDPGRRSLVSRRREWAWYRGPGQTAAEVAPPVPDVGPVPGPRYGITGVGVTPYVMNCNVTIDSTDLRLGRRIARALRASSPGGLPGVEAMAFPHEGRVEVACNVRCFGSLQEEEDNARGATGGADGGASDHVPASRFEYTEPARVEARVRELAAGAGVGLVGTALVGFMPGRCLRLAEEAIAAGVPDFWRRREGRHIDDGDNEQPREAAHRTSPLEPSAPRIAWPWPERSSPHEAGTLSAPGRAPGRSGHASTAAAPCPEVGSSPALKPPPPPLMVVVAVVPQGSGEMGAKRRGLATATISVTAADAARRRSSAPALLMSSRTYPRLQPWQWQQEEASRMAAGTFSISAPCRV
ncbi:formiminotransferase N-terminal subdomain-containing protein isoform X2 [Petromyzon marinus]